MDIIEALEILSGVIILLIIWMVTDIIGSWRIFKKAGESRWKALIPFYSTYTMYKVTWHTFAFWVYGGIIITNVLCSYLSQANVIAVLGSFLALTTLGIHIEQMHRLAVCFHKGFWFTVGLVFLKPIFILILAFDKSDYTYVKTDSRLLHEIKNNLVVQTENHKMKLKQLSEEKDETKKFAQGFCFKKVFIFFIIGCLVGTYWEEILYFFTHHFQTTDRQGMLYGPFSPIYGVGISIFVLLLGKNNDKHTILKTYLYSCLIGGVVEYLTSFIAEKCFGVTFWDYHGMFLNINGRTTIPYMLFWGLGGLVIMKVGYPLISKWLEKIPLRWGNIIFRIFFVLFMIDFILTYSAFGRMALRDNGVKPYTFYGEFLDKAYPDDYMSKKFPVMNN
ncbi:MAG: DUF5684 domain-containing protein [Lachnospiraceae bacterium]|nr:DUF5684 domain-containing protein [Lachnospiraceae bacterium]MDD3616784.1 DUF5684 domain-containing protein [Lachnospiraceae bacterium]